MDMRPISERTNQRAHLELFLLHLRYREGYFLRAEGNDALLLDDTEMVWIVYTSTVDVFASTLDVHGAPSNRRHLFRAEVGDILMGMPVPEAAAQVRLQVRGTPGARLLRLPLARLWTLAEELEYRPLVSAMLERWVSQCADSMIPRLPPKGAQSLSAEQELALLDGHTVLATQGLVWVAAIDTRWHWYGTYITEPLPFLPLTKSAWATIQRDATIVGHTTDSLFERELPAVLRSWHLLFCQMLGADQDAMLAETRERLVRRVYHDAHVMGEAIDVLMQPLAMGRAPVVPTTRGVTLVAACRMVGEPQGISFQDLPGAIAALPLAEQLKALARRSNVRMRGVGLRGNWWETATTPLLAFTADGSMAVPLLPHRGGYRAYASETATWQPVDASFAATLLGLAYMFYRPFGPGPLNGWNLLRFGVRGIGRDLGLVALVAGMIAALALVPPIAIGYIVNTVIPTGSIDSLVQVGIALLAVVLVSGALAVVRGLTMVRVQGHLDATLQAAIWDRLLNLPVPFFRKYTAGDLGSRAMAISEIRRALSGHVVTTLLNGLFSIFNVVLLVAYAPPLALVALALIAVAMTTVVGLAVATVRNQRALYDVQSQVGSLVLQILRGIGKIRVAGAERYAFAQWAGLYAQHKWLYRGNRTITSVLTTYNAVYPLIVLMVLFVIIGVAQRFPMPVGDFLAFQLALTQFLGAWFMLGNTLIFVLPILTSYERLKPIIEATPEVQEHRVPAGELSGQIEVSHVSFRYNPQGALTLDDVSLTVKPGEFVALVGASGSGKSSLLRLLLGFDTPETGGIFFDDHDLTDLDIQSVRSQIGVVLQSASLMAGDIYTNIIGSSPSLTIDDAWRAATMVGLADDIRALPMGMHTVITEGGGNFSGGQRQRLLIARAIVHQPRILFFDEATSALDNQTQEIVSQSIEQLQATRLVIAHRFSTIMRADRVYVFDRGRIVQSGTYESLMNVPGPFAELARRQMA